MSGRKVIVLLGPPGAGKGTQAKKLIRHFKLAHVATGDILRSEVRKGTAVGTKIKEVMEAGELVPDYLVGQIIRGCLTDNLKAPGFILDGYPRNVKQAEFLHSVIGKMSIYAISIKVDEKLLLRRLAGRRHCPNCGKIYNVYFSPPLTAGRCDECGARLIHRRDDDEKVVHERLKIYKKQTRPVIDFFSSRGNYFEVNGNQDVCDVFKDLSEIVCDIQQ